YDTERFANQKQRDMACMVSPVCAFPGCRHGAYGAEIHHVEAWKHGGQTNMDNLVPLCRYHNRVNDDDPWRKSRGRIAMIRGAPWWISPRGYHLRNTDRGALDQLFGPRRAGP
ncbi:HNH endonuclease signature motif containing protein, partial [Corynebacterium sp. MSK008]|uniref:HNH endonuclease signature motif containing protein n=1 Tax=Corynebacterium sp. MSK008 TaxID=3050188 RepID=UPI00254D834B